MPSIDLNTQKLVYIPEQLKRSSQNKSINFIGDSFLEIGQDVFSSLKYGDTIRVAPYVRLSYDDIFKLKPIVLDILFIWNFPSNHDPNLKGYTIECDYTLENVFQTSLGTPFEQIKE